jgi:transcriptional regulator with XRE-family HTH domain
MRDLRKMKEADASILLAFGQRLRAVRTATQISQEALAELAELDRTYISLLERGKRNPSLACVANLAQALNVTVSELCDFTKDAD